MKKINIWYWVFTVLLCLSMVPSAIFNLLSSKEWIDIFKSLGYPAYLLPFLGVAKFLGIIALLVPGFNRLKEWAYAGFFFDIAGALYSAIALKTPWMYLSIFLVYFLLIGLSYIYHHKRLKAGQN
ncbi:DoxX family protein [Mucilaginibacter hurinus]|uniref:DoxX family protein n=1 Tax=Mucilaginibacter hurinus TaxID=2201324 RepID=A0A367GN41_9SPHI|nr:DoxX family protein [Mucilaginibacter hurinus]RCH54894.1 DoxX family protein [Mucilaginibacter hurinus]